MPNNWKTYKLSQVIKIIGGGTPKTSESKYWDGNIPWLSVKDFQGERKFIYETEKTISDEGLKKSSTKLLPKNAIIISARGTVGELAVLGKEMAFNQSCYGILPNKKVDNQYLYYLLKQKVLELQGLSYGSVFDTITTKTFDGLDVKIPENFQEQQSIAAILSAIDDKIENNLAINKTLEEMAMALYKHWFVDFGPFQEGEFVESELGMIPKGWEVKSFFELFDLLSGGTPKTSVNEYWNGDINWVSAKDIGSNNKSFYINDTEKKVTELGIKKSAAKILPEDAVIVVARGSVGKYGMITKPMAMNQSCYGIHSKSQYSQPLTYLLIQSLINHFIQVSYGSVFDTITTSTFQNINVLVPPTEVFEKVKQGVDVNFEQIKQNIKENQTLTQLRDTLLPQLISGEVRLKEFQEQVEKVVYDSY